MSTKETTPTYVLGQSETEQERLIPQSEFYEALTKEVLVNAGVGPGMRVLDLGCLHRWWVPRAPCLASVGQASLWSVPACAPSERSWQTLPSLKPI